MSEGDLHPALFQQPVDRLALGVERVDGDRPERGGGRHLAALVHRLGQHRRRPPQLLLLAGEAAPLPPPAPSPAASTSSLVTFAPGPVPLTAPMSTPVAAAILRATGVALTSAPPLPALGPGAISTRARWRRGGDSENEATPRPQGLPAAAPRPCRSEPLARLHLGQRGPDRHLVVDRRDSFVITPLVGAGTSASTLSVETSTTVSPSLTKSPSATCHSRTMPSVTDSPISGIAICTVAVSGISSLQSMKPGASARGRDTLVPDELLRDRRHRIHRPQSGRPAAAARGHDLRPGAGWIAGPAGGAARRLGRRRGAGRPGGRRPDPGRAGDLRGGPGGDAGRDRALFPCGTRSRRANGQLRSHSPSSASVSSSRASASRSSGTRTRICSQFV